MGDQLRDGVCVKDGNDWTCTWDLDISLEQFEADYTIDITAIDDAGNTDTFTEQVHLV